MTRLGQNAWLWRAIIFKGFNGWFIIVAMALFSQDVAWDTMTGFQRLRWVIMGLIAGGKFIEGFIDQDLGRTRATIQQALGLSNGNTQTISRQDIQQTTVQTSEIKTEPKI